MRRGPEGGSPVQGRSKSPGDVMRAGPGRGCASREQWRRKKNTGDINLLCWLEPSDPHLCKDLGRVPSCRHLKKSL